MQSRKAFTLMELLIAVTLMVLAITITLFATIGTNSLIERTEQRAQIVQGTRETVDSLRRGLSSVSIRNVSIIKAAEYDTGNDNILSLTRVDYGDSEQGFVVEIKRFGAAQRDNTCQLLGRATVTRDNNGNEKFFLRADGSQIALLVYKMNPTGMCVYSEVLYRGTLTNSDVNVTNFSATIVPADYSCSGAPSCSIGQLRYRLSIESKTFVNQRQSAIDSSGSVPILLEHKNLPPRMRGISFNPPGPLTLSPLDPVTISVIAGYTDNSISDVTNDVNTSIVAGGGSYNRGTKIYTAGSVPGTYEITATHGDFTAIASVTITRGGNGGGEVTLVSLQLTPAAACVVSSQSLNLTVIGRYSDDTTDDFTGRVEYSVANGGEVRFGSYQAREGTYNDSVTARLGAIISNASSIQVASECGGTGGVGGGGKTVL